MSADVRNYLIGKVVDPARKVRHVEHDVRGDGLSYAVGELDRAVDALEEFEGKMAEIESSFASSNSEATQEDIDTGCRCGKCSNIWCVEHPGPPYGDYIDKPLPS